MTMTAKQIADVRKKLSESVDIYLEALGTNLTDKQIERLARAFRKVGKV